jgi:hypothetical protein
MPKIVWVSCLGALDRLGVRLEVALRRHQRSPVLRSRRRSARSSAPARICAHRRRWSRRRSVGWPLSPVDCQCASPVGRRPDDRWGSSPSRPCRASGLRAVGVRSPSPGRRGRPRCSTRPDRRVTRLVRRQASEDLPCRLRMRVVGDIARLHRPAAAAASSAGRVDDRSDRGRIGAERAVARVGDWLRAAVRNPSTTNKPSPDDRRGRASFRMPTSVPCVNCWVMPFRRARPGPRPSSSTASATAANISPNCGACCFLKPTEPDVRDVVRNDRREVGLCALEARKRRVEMTWTSS